MGCGKSRTGTVTISGLNRYATTPTYVDFLTGTSVRRLEMCLAFTWCILMWKVDQTGRARGEIVGVRAVMASPT